MRLVEECGDDPQAVLNYFLGKQKEGEAESRKYVTLPFKPAEHPRQELITKPF